MIFLKRIATSVLALIFLGTVNLAFSSENSDPAESIEVISGLDNQDIQSQCQHTVVNPTLVTINQLVTAFKEKYSQFDYGIRSMEGLYDAIANPEDIYAEMEDHSCGRSILFIGELLIGAACEVVKTLSVFHPKVEEYGTALIALYATKSILWGIDSWLNNSARQTSVNVMNALQTDPQMVSYVSGISSEVSQIDVNPVIAIASNIINSVKNSSLSESDAKKLERLSYLNNKLQNTTSTKKFLLNGGKIVSFITGVATGISVAATGQESSSSYWLTLFAGGLDSIVDSANTTITKKPKTWPP